MKRSQGGFSMIEILVTIAILLVGLLGLAALQTRTTVAELEAFQRSQALVLVQDIAERMATNKAQAASYLATNVGLAEQSCAAMTGAQLDLCEWGNQLAGASTVTTAGSRKVGAMIGARGCVELQSPNVYLITVAWQGFSAAGSPAATCGSGAYGAGMRRTISVVFRVGTLGA